MARLDLLKFQPIFRPMIWGGSKISRLFPDAPHDQPIGEAWILSDEGEQKSRVADGLHASASLRELLSTHAQDIFGQNSQAPEAFPLLFKIIDARQHLSIQVHPNDDLARRLVNYPRGKTEAWVVIDSEPEGKIYSGLKSGVTRTDVENALNQGHLAELLHSFHPESGDCIFIPAGTVHALGAGVMVFEVQQTSDITFRMHDWGRVDPATGRSRTLHIAESLECSDYHSGPVHPRPQKLQPGFHQESLVLCDFFSLNRYQSDAAFDLQYDVGCSVLVAIQGEGVLESPFSSTSLKPGYAILRPSCVSKIRCIPSESSLTLLECRLPL